jgi:recombination protein RecA
MAKKSKKTTPSRTEGGAAGLVSRINRRLKAELAATFAAEPRAVTAIPTGIDVLDRYVLGCGGLPVGRIVEVYSEEGVGKSSFVLHCLAAAQRSGGTAVLIETENALESARAEAFGCDLRELVLLTPDDLDGVLSAAEAVLMEAKRKPVLLAWDSVAGTPTKREVEEGLTGEARIGERAKKLSGACRLLTGLASKHKASLLFVNQIRDNIGVMYGDKYTTPGGHAVKYAASIRLQLYGGKGVKDGAEHVAKSVTFLAAKNRFAPPFRKARVRLSYSTGWDDDWSTIEHAKDRGLVPEAAPANAKTLTEARKALGWEVAT